MSAVTTQTQQVLACIMVAVLCILGAMFSLDQLCTFKPKTTRDWCCAVAIVVLFVVVFAYLCDRSVKCVHRRREPFADYDTNEYSWGAAPNKSIEYADADNAAPFDQEHTSSIIGPKSTGEELYTWQYNPQNTLVDYKFYEVDSDDNDPTRLAPVINGDIGRRNAAPEAIQGVGVCNNNAAGTGYTVQSPASAAPVPTGTVDWQY